MKIHAATLCVLAVMLCACVATPEAQRTALAGASPCCKSFAELPATTAFGEGVKLEITSTSPVFDFPAGRSHFMAVELPANSGSKTLEVRSLIRTAPTVIDGRGGHPSFFPVVTFLDERRQPQGTFSEDKPTPAMVWGTGGYVSTFTIPPEARFAVVHTYPRKIGETYTAWMKSSGTTVMVGGGVISTGAGTTHMATIFESTGTVRLAILPRTHQ